MKNPNQRWWVFPDFEEFIPFKMSVGEGDRFFTGSMERVYVFPCDAVGGLDDERSKVHSRPEKGKKSLGLFMQQAHATGFINVAGAGVLYSHQNELKAYGLCGTNVK